MRLIDEITGEETTLEEALEALNPSGYVSREERHRPYDGQPHTDAGERGKTLVVGLTMRDVRDCLIRGCFEASGLRHEMWPDSIYALPWEEMDIFAVANQMLVEIERLMGIYPNVPRLESSPVLPTLRLEED